MLAMKPTHTRLHGFTLIEMMITLALASVLMMVAVPSFLAFQRNAELTAVPNTLLAAMNTARSEAMKRNLNVRVEPLTTAGWTSGWRVFVDSDRSNGFNTGDVVVATYPALKTYFDATGTGIASGSAPYVMFNGSGYARQQNGALGPVTIEVKRNDLTGSALLEQTRRLKVASTGRVRVCKPTSATDVNCSASAND